MSEKYSKDYKCKNCGAYKWLHIPQGQSVETFLNEKLTTCERCGVRLGKKIENEPQSEEEPEETEETK